MRSIGGIKYYGFDGTKDFPIKVGYIIKFKALSPICKHYYEIGIAPHLQQFPKTKDSYINLRGEPKNDGKKARRDYRANPSGRFKK